MKAAALILLLSTRTLIADEPSADDRVKAAAYFTEMRMQYAKRPEFRGSWEDDPQRDALLKSYELDSPQPFLADFAAWLKKCPVDSYIHSLRGEKLIDVGDVKGCYYHRLVSYGLFTSIAVSGDGKTPQTAYHVISVDEEYTLLNDLEADVKSQALIDLRYDAMTVELKGAETVIYFDVSIPMAARAKHQAK